MARMRDRVYVGYRTFKRNGQEEGIVLPKAKGPPGVTIAYAITAPLLTITSGEGAPTTAPDNRSALRYYQPGDLRDDAPYNRELRGNLHR